MRFINAHYIHPPNLKPGMIFTKIRQSNIDFRRALAFTLLAFAFNYGRLRTFLLCSPLVLDASENVSAISSKNGVPLDGPVYLGSFFAQLRYRLLITDRKTYRYDDVPSKGGTLATSRCNFILFLCTNMLPDIISLFFVSIFHHPVWGNHTLGHLASLHSFRSRPSWEQTVNGKRRILKIKFLGPDLRWTLGMGWESIDGKRSQHVLPEVVANVIYQFPFPDVMIAISSRVLSVFQQPHESDREITPWPVLFSFSLNISLGQSINRTIPLASPSLNHSQLRLLPLIAFIQTLRLRLSADRLPNESIHVSWLQTQTPDRYLRQGKAVTIASMSV